MQTVTISIKSLAKALLVAEKNGAKAFLGEFYANRDN